MLNLSRKKAARLLQNAYRLAVRTRCCRCHRKKILSAASVIQQAGRGWVARRVVEGRRETRRRDRAAAILQRTIQRYLRKLLEHRQHVAAALILCRFVRRFLVQLLQMRRSRQSSAATRIQSVFRVYRSRARVGALRADQRVFAEASRIQAVPRGNKSRVETSGCVPARTIQAAYRGHRSRTQTRTLQGRPEEPAAATRIQSVFKGHKSRLQTQALHVKRHACAVKIQRLLLHHVREAKRTSRRQRECSALGLQRARMTSDQKLPQHDPSTINTCNNRGSSWEVSPSEKSRHNADRTSLQLVVEALAHGMSRRNVLTTIDSGDLKETLALPQGDPVLETVLRQRLLGIEVTLDSSIGRVVGTCEPVVSTTVDGAVVEEALRRSLRTLEKGLLKPSE